MKKTNNGYTIYKVNNIYDFPELQKILCASFAKQLEAFDIRTGEPIAMRKENLYGFYTTSSMFLYDIVKDKILIKFDKGKNVYYDLLEDCVDDLKNFKKTLQKSTLESIIESINSFKELGVDWNSYRCNPVDHNVIGEAIRFITYFYDKINHDEVSLSVYPIADGGNEVKRPPADSFSIVGFNLTNGEREIELEVISPSLNIDPIVYEHVYKDNDSSLSWPKEFSKYNDEYTIDPDYKNDEFLKEAVQWIHYEI